MVIDGNLITGAGVSAGLDFRLKLVEMIRGRSYAEAVQLTAEYAPEPPLSSGTPAAAKPEILYPMHGMFASALFQMEQVAKNRRG